MLRFKERFKTEYGGSENHANGVGSRRLEAYALTRKNHALKQAARPSAGGRVSMSLNRRLRAYERSENAASLGFQRGKRLFQFNLQELQGGFSSYNRRLQRKIGHATIFQAYKSYPGRPLAVEIKKSVGFQILQSYLSMEVLSHIP